MPWGQITSLNLCGLSVLAVSTHFIISGRRLPWYTLLCSKFFSSFQNLHGHFIVKLRFYLVDSRVFISKIDVIWGFGVRNSISVSISVSISFSISISVSISFSIRISVSISFSISMSVSIRLSISISKTINQ